VEQAIVVARDLADGERSLVAYVVQSAGTAVGESELKTALRQRLPDYMIPSVFVKLGSLPLSSSGKVDRAALPLPTAENTLREGTFVAPRTPIEERISEILAPLVGLEHVGIEDNFFMLGGHSLMGTQLIARLREAFGVDLSLRTIFDAPTIADLSERVEMELVARLEAMSEEEVERTLNSGDDAFLHGA
jgi:acyl carrier protein